MSKSTVRPIIAVAAVAWLVVGGCGLREVIASGSGDDWDWVAYGIFAISLLVGSLLTVVAVWAVSRSGERSLVRSIGLAVCALGVLSTVVAWALPLWATVFAVGYALIALSGSQPWRRPVAFLAAAPLLGMTAQIIGAASELGPADDYGDHPASLGVGLAIAAAVTLVSLYQLDRTVGASEPSLPAPAQSARP